MKKVAVLLCALSLLAVPACKRRDSGCASCHEKREHVHECHKGHCSFFGRCTEGEGRTEHHRYDDAEDMEMQK